MRLPTLPKPPVPKRFQDKPAPPGHAEKAKPLEQVKEAGITAADWVDERTSLSGGVRWMPSGGAEGHQLVLHARSATMFAFVSQAITGVFLAMYYAPSPTQAYESARHITNDVFLGEFVRGMHKWGSLVMVILIFLHMGRTFFFGACKYPRELNWIIGVVLVILTFLMSLTGYLLPSTSAPTGRRSAANNNATGPLVGPYLSDFLRGGPDFGATTLSRFYAIHMMLVPGLIAALIGAHLYLVARLGTTRPPGHGPTSTRSSARKNMPQARRLRPSPLPPPPPNDSPPAGVDEPGEKEAYLREYTLLKAKGKPFFPYAVAKDAIMMMIVMIVDHRDVDRPGRGAGPEGGIRRRPPTCRGRSGTSSSSSSSCASSSRRSWGRSPRSASRRSA